METFIKNHEFNYIKRCMKDLNNSLVLCVDKDIIQANKLYINQKILDKFSNLSKEQKNLLDISKITEQYQIDFYLEKLLNYVYESPNITNAQINRLFKKEKKFKLPSEDIFNIKTTYLGWIDNQIRKLFIAYNLDGNLVGMACRISNPEPKSSHRCVLCNHIGKENEVAFVSPICKQSSKDAYKSIGFDICLNSKDCNERIVSIDKLEDLLKTVNNIK
ncbi:MAG: FusB/FusC family EF-G-binding protein [Clostridium sp.]|uniref:FusB/FusC family EF-G-binding protein n=1 Tax=Clostridium sp. TaxID=1506 RepID=UPI00290BA1E7|nr:FusB/FusC family EF-G-binding protein [Clostridium sp.]MDU7148062.1 FusB/FusC family EF-G-binding protein [Clostridium sp.]